MPPVPRSTEESYARLRTIARKLLARERRDHTLTPTALVHEAFLRWAIHARARAASAPPAPILPRLTMQRILKDHARSRQRLKRACPGGTRLELDPDALCTEIDETNALALKEALQHLREASPERAEVWEAHHLAGRDTDQLAAERGISQRNVQLWIRSASSFLAARLATRNS